MAIITKAIVAYEPLTPRQPNFALETVSLRELNDDELLVRMVATGICHSDITVGSAPGESRPYPRVLGHEGAGIVEKIGKNVTRAEPGSRVILSPCSCLTCHQCKTGHSGCCQAFYPLNIAGDKSVFKREVPGSIDESNDTSCYGSMFGQSSFANLSIVKESSVLDITNHILNDEELKLFAPMGCGYQTGAATVTNVAKATAKDVIVIMGLGGVGLAAVMASKIQNCHKIIALDRIPARLQLASQIGATHTINTTSKEPHDLIHEIKSLSGTTGGATITIDTTGNLGLISTAMEFISKAGKLVLVGVPAPDAVLNVGLGSFLTSGKSIIASMMGDAVPAEYIPKMIQWYRQGDFPIDKLVKYYPAEDFQNALDDMLVGKTVKPVLVW